ncbi:MAG: potassium channel family protein [Acidobacteria bacterium]|nr:potassium channel family protein [Acidobacteriota bacterium]
MHPKLHTISEVSLIIAALATIPVVILEERGAASGWLPLADWGIWLVFAAALAMGTFYAENRGLHLRRHPMDIAVVVLSFPMFPILLSLTRLIRVVRVLRVMTVVARSIPALKATIGRRELLYACSVCVFLGISGAVTLLILEPDTVGHSFINALWWSAVTITTVGYGDIAPLTVPGRVAAIIVMLAGLGVISTLSASIAAYFVEQGNHSDLRQIEERLKRIESILEREAAERHTSTRR